jgi:hypothetical protein
VVEIDGGQRSGSGTIVRGALALAALLGEPLHLHNIRARRPKPGLRAQHLTATRAIAELTDAFVDAQPDAFGHAQSDAFTYAQPGGNADRAAYRCPSSTARFSRGDRDAAGTHPLTNASPRSPADAQPNHSSPHASGPAADGWRRSDHFAARLVLGRAGDGRRRSPYVGGKPGLVAQAAKRLTNRPVGCQNVIRICRVDVLRYLRQS